MTVTDISKDNFKEEVLNYKGIVLVDFYAQWCGPCKMISPLINDLSKEIKTIKFVKINVDESPDLVTQYSIFSIPTFLLFKDGQVVNQFIGALSREGFIKEINKITTK